MSDNFYSALFLNDYAFHMINLMTLGIEPGVFIGVLQNFLTTFAYTHYSLCLEAMKNMPSQLMFPAPRSFA